MKTIAHVGHTKTSGDLKRIFTVIEWYERHTGERFSFQGDCLDLNKGRDFLLEPNTYDAVVLHFIFRGGFTNLVDKRKALKVSPKASWYEWRKRLVATGAKYIFAFGGMAEVGGTFLVDLDGYRSIQVEPEFWVFERI